MEKEKKLKKHKPGPYTKGIIGLHPDGSVIAFYEGRMNEMEKCPRFKVIMSSSGMIKIVAGRGSHEPEPKDALEAILEVTNLIEPTKAEMYKDTTASGREYLCANFHKTKYSMGIVKHGIGTRISFRDKEEIPAFVARALATQLLNSI